MKGKIQDQLLEQWHAGSKEACDKLFELALDDLQQIAGCLLRKELRKEHTLQSDGLVHQCYVKMCRSSAVPRMDQASFLRFAAHVMKQVLIDYGRRRRRRAEGREMVTFDDENPEVMPSFGLRYAMDPNAVLSLEMALQELRDIDAVAATVADFKLNQGLSLRTVSRQMSLPYDGVKQEWRCAALFLARRLGLTRNPNRSGFSPKKQTVNP
jgi:RNA polymerase sigma factor (TIGR02999 family)